MDKEYKKLWVQMGGIEGWEKTKDEIKELVTDPLQWAINLIEYATQNRTDTPASIGVNEAAWLKVGMALDVLKWYNEIDEE